MGGGIIPPYGQAIDGRCRRQLDTYRGPDEHSNADSVCCAAVALDRAGSMSDRCAGSAEGSRAQVLTPGFMCNLFIRKTNQASLARFPCKMESSRFRSSS